MTKILDSGVLYLHNMKKKSSNKLLLLELDSLQLMIYC